MIIFDEPTAGLDPEERLRFKMIVSALPKNKVTLISTHIVEDVDAPFAGTLSSLTAGMCALTETPKR